MTFLIETMKLGLSNLRLHLLRSILTALGIILGVGAVITMVSIGEGSKRDALMQIERLGARNIIVRSQKPAESVQQQGGQQRSWSIKYGLTRADLRVIEERMEGHEGLVPLKSVGGQVLRADRRQTSQAFGTTPDLLEVANLRLARGRYLTWSDLEQETAVAVIGTEVAKELFPWEDPLGSTIRIDSQAYTVVGVLGAVGLSGGAGAALVGRDLNLDVHVPITTARMHFGDQIIRRTSGSFEAAQVELSELYFVSPTREQVLTDAALVRRVLEQRHNGLSDIGMIVPYELLENARRAALTWNLVLGAVASISLLVGGIGIMNIMLATVTERTREIGIRRALGATRKHIVWQFLVETGVLSSIGGLIGVGLGIGFSVGIGLLVPVLPRMPLIGAWFDPDVQLPTQVTGWSVVVAFLVATATGLVFGIYPARKASMQDPIVALRHD